LRIADVGMGVGECESDRSRSVLRKMWVMHRGGNGGSDPEGGSEQ